MCAAVESSPFEARAFGAPTLCFSKCHFTLWCAGCADCAAIEKDLEADEASEADIESKRDKERPADLSRLSIGLSIGLFQTEVPPPAAGAAAGAACAERVK